MKRKLSVGVLLAGIVSPVYAIDQWPGQSDFNNLNGPVKNRNIFGQSPVLDFRFNPQTAKPLQPQPLPSGRTTLTPSQYSYCLQYQYNRPTSDISCAGPNLP